MMSLDDMTKYDVAKEIDNVGIQKFASRMLEMLDCSRIWKGMRLMQTIGFPYCYYISKLINGLTYSKNKNLNNSNELNEIYNKLVSLHEANVKFEEENPPKIYDKRRPVKNARKTKKYSETSIDMFVPETKQTKEPVKQVKLSQRTQFINSLKFKIK